MANRSGFTFRQIGNYRDYDVHLNGEYLGVVGARASGWVAQPPHPVNRHDTYYPTRQHAAIRLSYDADARKQPASPDVALMLNANIGQ